MSRPFDRREFLCGGCAAITLAGCGGPGVSDAITGATGDTGGTVPTVTNTDPLANPNYPCDQAIQPEAEGWIGYPLSVHSELAPVGGSKGLVVAGTNPAFWIVIAHVQEGCYVAVARNCTHSGTLINYDEARAQFVCPNHGSIFDWEGTPVAGPAPLGLEVFTAGLDGDRVWVDLRDVLAR